MLDAALRILRLNWLNVLADEKCRRSLRRYFGILEEKRKAQFLVSRMLKVDYGEDGDDNALWRVHEVFTNEYVKLLSEVDSGTVKYENDMKPEKSYFDLKIALAKRMMRKCHFCFRACGIDRTTGGRGYCKCGNEVVISSAFDHWGEEPELVPSGTIFTCGCTMTCLHCQNYSISQWMEDGTQASVEDLARIVERLHIRGCRNANLVGGDPTPWLEAWLRAFKIVSVNVPVVWNSNTYYSEETAKLLAGFADVYLLDFKYGPGDCAERISNAPHYWDVCTRNHLIANRYGEMIIRILVLPGHVECCARPILEWISKNLGSGTRVNVMFQYRPEWRADEIPELRRRLTAEEKNRSLELARDAGLENLAA
jgi:putative pyruvate formate lyase activating enzyme